MNNRTITSANANLTLAVPPLYGARLIQGWGSDDFTDMDSVDIGENVMGIDGRLSSGFAPVERRQNITLNADSLSLDFFENWAEAEQTMRERFAASGTLTFPATGRKYNLVRGFLTGYTPIPAARKTLQARRFTIVWESVQGAPVTTLGSAINGVIGAFVGG